MISSVRGDDAALYTVELWVSGATLLAMIFVNSAMPGRGTNAATETNQKANAAPLRRRRGRDLAEREERHRKERGNEDPGREPGPRHDAALEVALDLQAELDPAGV
ncbi:MAG: hypothetical protein AAF957_12340 [Planctomycetota bacterium]